MSHEAAEDLAFWACPVIVSPAEGVERGKKRLRKLPFPMIDPSLEGFTLSHLPWVGINVTRRQRREQLIKLAWLHEDCHQELARTPFQLYVKELILKFYVRLWETFEEGRARIEVPLSAAKAGNDLKEHWELILWCKN